VPSTPSTFCSKCGATRIDIRFKCCGAGYHARCVYPWPCTSCPSCRRPVTGMEILPLEPFSRNGELVQVSERVAAQTRGGRWSDAELKVSFPHLPQIPVNLRPDIETEMTFVCLMT
jgi:hypothetical protein